MFYTILLFILIIIFLYYYFRDTKKEKIILVTQYYIPKNKEREQEINTCLIKNLENNIIDEIHLYIENDYDFNFLKNKNKIKFIKTNKQLSYNTVFNYSNIYDKNHIIILSNSDIYFNNTLKNIYDLNFKNVFYALNRYDIDKNNKLVLYDVNYSQDVWIWKPPINIIINDNNINDYFDINDGIILGVGGCDNRILKVVKDSGYIIKNASDKIQSIHNHKNNYRTWINDKEKLELRKKYISNGIITLN